MDQGFMKVFLGILWELEVHIAQRNAVMKTGGRDLMAAGQNHTVGFGGLLLF